MTNQEMATTATVDAATEALHSTPCPGCGCEPEVASYWRRAGVRVGYVCTCGASVIDGLMVGHSLG